MTEQECRDHLEGLIHDNAHPLSQAFYQQLLALADGKRVRALLVEAARMHWKKQKDYGRAEDPFANVRASEEFGIQAWVGALLRGNDKMARLKKFITEGELANEGAEDSMLDLSVYALIALALFRTT